MTHGRGPGRPAGLRGADLLGVAREVFLDRGFAGTTMQEVAARAGVSKASLYQEHPSKDALFAAVVTDWARRGRGAMRPALDALLGAGSVRTGLVDFLQTLQAAVLDDGPLRMRRLVAAESDRFPDVAAQYVAASWDANMTALAETLLLLHDRGAIAIPDPQVAAEQLTWMAVGGPLNAQTLGAPGVPSNRLRVLADAAADAFLRSHGFRRSTGGAHGRR